MTLVKIVANVLVFSKLNRKDTWYFFPDVNRVANKRDSFSVAEINIWLMVIILDVKAEK